LHADTCCAKDGVAANLGDIQSSLKQLALNGISQQCYYALANLECIACDPTQTVTMEPSGTIEGGNSQVLIDQIFTMRLCTSLCTEIFNACKDDSSAAALGATVSGSNYVEFCESIDGSFLTYSKTDVTSIFYSAKFLVSDFDCFGGVSLDVIESDVGVCLDSYEDSLIPEEIIYVFGSASTTTISILLLIISLLFI